MFILQNLESFPASNQTLFTWMLCVTRDITIKSIKPLKNSLSDKIPKTNKIVSIGKLGLQNKKEVTREQKILELICLNELTVQKASEMLKIPEEVLKINLRATLTKYKKNKIL